MTQNKNKKKIINSSTNNSNGYAIHMVIMVIHMVIHMVMSKFLPTSGFKWIDPKD